nr:orf15 [Trichoplusia ni single nucleopolyhedrovirus]
MIVNLYYPQDKDSLITFSLINAINSINIIPFQINESADTDGDEINHNFASTRLVSGYERGRGDRVNIAIRMQCLQPPIDRTSIRNAYVISCVRLPFFCVSLVTHKNFSRPILPVLVDCKGEIQVWHIFTVNKNHEPATFQRVKGVTVCVHGIENYFAKELVVLRGNIPSHFIASLSKTYTNPKDIEMAAFIYPNVCINREDVRIECI